MKVIKPLYKIFEAENHWFRIYYSHYLEYLRMSQSTFDPCLLYTMDSPNSRESTGFGIVGLQTDDTLILADATFAESEEIELQKAQFLAKDREKLTIEKLLKFNGSMVKLEPDGITLT
ncbi:Ribonuclease H-like domain [Aspergillus affinis]|uniref:Ribonuclease H-like domain n=1 Tax=Aspergillus affinis TaxID=1070780 RepID=UPI0022FE7A93|nr:Ribonuclease H-like domain [Aspergillus affinis]KAI9044858.1 Ribonuclease H-like domain [Aspergillus affinis]